MGTTTCALALSNYINNKLGEKVAYIELNGTDEIACLSKKKEQKPFSYYGIAMYPSITMRNLETIFSFHFSYFILDMGAWNPNTISTFWRSDLCLIMCSLSPWQKSNREEFMKKLPENNILNQEKVILLANLGIKEQLAAFKQNIFHDVRCFPYLPNPFRLTPKDWPFFETLLTGRIYHNYCKRGHFYDDKN